MIHHIQRSEQPLRTQTIHLCLPIPSACASPPLDPLPVQVLSLSHIQVALGIDIHRYSLRSQSIFFYAVPQCSHHCSSCPAARPARRQGLRTDIPDRVLHGHTTHYTTQRRPVDEAVSILAQPRAVQRQGALPDHGHGQRRRGWRICDRYHRGPAHILRPAVEPSVPTPARHLDPDARLLPCRCLPPLPRLAELHDLARHARQHRAAQHAPLDVWPR